MNCPIQDTLRLAKLAHWLLDGLFLIGLLSVALLLNHYTQNKESIAQLAQNKEQLQNTIKRNDALSSKPATLFKTVPHETQVWRSLNEWLANTQPPEGYCTLNAPTPFQDGYEIQCAGHSQQSTPLNKIDPTKDTLQSLEILKNSDKEEANKPALQSKKTANGTTPKPTEKNKNTRGWFETEKGRLLFNPQKQQWHQ